MALVQKEKDQIEVVGLAFAVVHSDHADASPFVVDSITFDTSKNIFTKIDLDVPETRSSFDRVSKNIYTDKSNPTT
jgi:hypothetical protein